MKKVFIALVLLFSFAFANIPEGEIKLPDVVFPLEIIAEKKEEKPPLKPPKTLSVEDVKVPIDISVPFPYPTDLKPVVGEIKKPKSFLGIPKEKAQLSEIIDDFVSGNFIIAFEKAKRYIDQYKENKKIDKNLLAVAYYVAGLSAFEIQDFETSAKLFENACSFDFYLKTESCVSGSAVYLMLSDVEKAEKLLTKAPSLDEGFFLKAVIDILKNNDYSLIKDVNCLSLDIGFINYCKLSKAYYYTNKDRLKDALKSLKEVSGYDKYKALVKGFIFLKQNKVEEALNTFEDYINRYSKADFLSKYAIYGYLVSLVKKGEVEKVLDEVGSLEIRDKNLAQNIYIHIAYQLLKQGKHLDALAVAQRALSIADKNKEVLKEIVGISAYNAGLYEYAYHILKQIRKPKFYLYTAFALINIGNFAEAEYFLKKAYKTATTPYQKETALKYLSEIYYKTGKDEELIKVLKELAKYDKRFTADMLGWFFFKKKDYENAYKAFNDPYMKAVSLFNLGKEDEAYKIVKKLKSRKARFLEAYIYLKKLQLDKARKILKELAKGNDKIAQEAGYLYAYSFFSNGEYEKAAKAFEEYYQRYKDTPLAKRAFLRMADSLYNLGKKKEAKLLYTEFIKKYAGTPEAIDAAYLLTVMEMKENTGDIENQIKQFIEKYPDYPHIDLLKLQLANVYFEKGETEKAVEILRELADKNTQVSQQALYRLGYILKTTGKTQEAKKVFMEYLLKYPEGEFVVPVKQLLAEIYEQEGNYQLAIKLYKELPQTDQNTYKIALLNFKEGNLFEAKKGFYKLYEKYPKYRNDIAYYLGMIEYKKGNIQQAKRFFEEATKGMDYKKVAQSYLILGKLYEEEGKLEDALNQYINIIYLYSQDKDLVEEARIRSAKILLKQGKRIEASCMLEPIASENEEAYNIKSKLPQCIKD